MQWILVNVALKKWCFFWRSVYMYANQLIDHKDQSKMKKLKIKFYLSSFIAIISLHIILHTF